MNFLAQGYSVNYSHSGVRILCTTSHFSLRQQAQQTTRTRTTCIAAYPVIENTCHSTSQARFFTYMDLFWTCRGRILSQVPWYGL